MPQQSESASPIEQTFESLQAVQAAGFQALEAVAEKVPGLPQVFANAAARGAEAWVRSYYTIAQRLLEAERHTAEHLVSLNKALVSPRATA